MAGEPEQKSEGQLGGALQWPGGKARVNGRGDKKRVDSSGQCQESGVKWAWGEAGKGDEEEGGVKGASEMFPWPGRMNGGGSAQLRNTGRRPALGKAGWEFGTWIKDASKTFPVGSRQLDIWLWSSEGRPGLSHPGAGCN